MNVGAGRVGPAITTSGSSATWRCNVAVRCGHDAALGGPMREAVSALSAGTSSQPSLPQIRLLDAAHGPLAADVALEVLDRGRFDAEFAAGLPLPAAGAGLRTLAVASSLQANELAALQRAGVDDFVCTPVSNEELLVRIARLAPPPGLSVDDGQRVQVRGLIGQSSEFLRMLERLPRVARFDVTTLLLGETGTGKEAVARAIHYLSPRGRGPWMAVNCAAIPVDLLEAELFGHVKGAFTHASQTRNGLVHEAQGGTLFLDEVDSLPYPAQAKVLRFLQDQTYRPVGSNQVVMADVRVVAASNRDLQQLVGQGGFRQDLYFRLNVLQLRLPALRERLDDVPVLARHFLDSAAVAWRLPAHTLTPAAVQALLRHHWPGNVRELKNVMERSALMSDSPRIEVADLDLGGNAARDPVADPSFCAAKARVVTDFERSYISQLLTAHGGNVAQAARAAKKNRRAFFELMRKHHIGREAFRKDGGPEPG